GRGRHLREPRLSGGLDAVLSGAALQARVHGLPDGLRVGDGDAAPRGRVRSHARDPPQLAPVGSLRGGGAMSSASAALPLSRRKLPAPVRRRRILLGIANHSILIAAAIAFL